MYCLIYTARALLPCTTSLRAYYSCTKVRDTIEWLYTARAGTVACVPPAPREPCTRFYSSSPALIKEHPLPLSLCRVCETESESHAETVRR